MYFPIMLKVPEITPHMMVLSGGFTGLRIWSYSWLRFITLKRYRVKSVKGAGPWGEVQRKPGTSFRESFPDGVLQDVLNSPSEL